MNFDLNIFTEYINNIHETNNISLYDIQIDSISPKNITYWIENENYLKYDAVPMLNYIKFARIYKIKKLKNED